MKTCTDIHGSKRLNPPDFCDPLFFSCSVQPAGWIFFFWREASQLWDGIAMKFCPDIHGSLMMYHFEFDDPPYFTWKEF